MPQLEDTPAAPRPRAIYWVASLALAAVLLYFSLRGIDWVQVWGILRGARPMIVVLSLALMTLSMFIRALRWRVLLSAEAPVSVPLAFWATSAGYLGNNVLPARAGEVVRTLIISRRTGLSKTFVLTTAFSERIVDAIVLITISALVLLTLSQRPGWLQEAAKPFAVIGLCGVAAIALLPVLESFWFRALGLLPVPHSMREKVEQLLRQVLQGIRSFHHAGRLTRFSLFTLVIWSLDGATAITGARALGISLSVPVTFLLIAGLGLGSALPSTPGYVGIYQFVAVSVLTPFGYSRADAIAFILLFQALNYVMVLMWGLIGLGKQRTPAVASE